MRDRYIASNPGPLSLARKKRGKYSGTQRRRAWSQASAIASELYAVDILSFNSVGRAKRGRTSQYEMVRSKLTYPRASWVALRAGCPSILAEMLRGNCS